MPVRRTQQGPRSSKTAKIFDVPSRSPNYDLAESHLPIHVKSQIISHVAEAFGINKQCLVNVDEMEFTMIDRWKV
jgi:hypothetical protein